MRTLKLVSITNWPDEITWTYDDGTTEISHEDVTTPAGRIAVARRAAAEGIGTRESNYHRLGGRHGDPGGVGPILTADPVEPELDREPPASMLVEFELPEARENKRGGFRTPGSAS